MLVIPISSKLYKFCHKIAASRRMVFMTGVPGVGKSLLIQQLALIATEAGRKVHLLQYNQAREPFEAANRQKYPEVDGVTDPVMRKAVGLWARQAVHNWHEAHPDPNHLLIGELPLIGNRLIELVETQDDAVEPLLCSEQVLFVIPVPSWEVREVIAATRARTIAAPQHEKEKLDAPPNVLQALWQEVNSLARQIGLTKARPNSPYNPYIYGGVFQALLQHRQAHPLLIEQVLRPTQSVYELDVLVTVLRPTAAEVAHYVDAVEQQYTPAALAAAVANWHSIITDDPQMPDPGPTLHLPLPETLPNALAQTTLTAVQREALQAIIALPLQATPAQILPALDAALAALEPDVVATPKTAAVHKFDVYDSYFNVTRTDEKSGIAFLAGLLQSYGNVLRNLQMDDHSLTVVEVPQLRIAFEISLHLFL